jgi:hypothetical protein
MMEQMMAHVMCYENDENILADAEAPTSADNKETHQIIRHILSH